MIFPIFRLIMAYIQTKFQEMWCQVSTTYAIELWENRVANIFCNVSALLIWKWQSETCLFHPMA